MRYTLTHEETWPFHFIIRADGFKVATISPVELHTKDDTFADMIARRPYTARQFAHLTFLVNCANNQLFYNEKMQKPFDFSPPADEEE